MSQAQILPINHGTIGNVPQQTVNARTLHNALGVRRDYTTWIKQRIGKYDFVENIDFSVFTKSGENLLGGRPSQEYTLTLGMAKELCMVENNEKGKLTRRYFIECERKLLNQLFGKTELSLEQDLTLSTVADRNPLDKLVKVWAKQTNQRFNECWRQVNASFNIESVTELPRAWIPDALKFVQERIDNQQTQLTAPQQPELPQGHDITEHLGNIKDFHENKFTQMVQDLHQQTETVKANIMFYGRMARKATMSKEMYALYRSAEDSVKIALCGLATAQYALQNTIRIKAGYDFRNGTPINLN